MIKGEPSYWAQNTCDKISTVAGTSSVITRTFQRSRGSTRSEVNVGRDSALESEPTTTTVGQGLRGPGSRSTERSGLLPQW